jgi:adenine-specific DNA methylase
MGFSIAEFEAQRASLACQHCRHVGLELERNPNDDGVRPICPHCGSKIPLSGVRWLKQDSAAGERSRKATELAVEHVWAAHGSRCIFCGAPRLLLRRLGIHPTAQPLVPVCFGGEATSPLIPLCVRCREARATALHDTLDIQRKLASLDETIKRIERRFPELTEGASSDFAT